MELFSLDNLVSLVLLVLLQAVLGFDNLLYISLESKRAPAASQAKVRWWGISIAVALRIVLLIILLKLVDSLKAPWFSLDWTGYVEGEFNFHALIVLLGGAFILYTATKEIWHMTAVEDLQHSERKPASVPMLVSSIVIMNLVFSFDSILSAMALTKVWQIMALAIVIGGILMIWLSDRVAEFLEKNRMYEVLGLFVLFVVGIMLLTEGGHLAQLKLFGNEIHAMTKTTFYFVIGVLVLTDVVQTRYQKKLLAERAALKAAAH